MVKGALSKSAWTMRSLFAVRSAAARSLRLDNVIAGSFVSAIFDRRNSIFEYRISIFLFQPLGSVYSMIGKDQVRTGALHSCQCFQRDLRLVDPAVGCR